MSEKDSQPSAKDKKEVKAEKADKSQKGDATKKDSKPKTDNKPQKLNKTQTKDKAQKTDSSQKDDKTQKTSKPKGDDQSQKGDNVKKDDKAEEDDKSQKTDNVNQDEKAKKDGDDLTTLLDQSQRADLTLLVANCTEAMRKVLLRNFNAAAGLKSELLQENMTEDQKMMSADPNADISEMDNERKLKAEAEKDLASHKMKSLKKDVLKAYDTWREQVLMRVGEVVNSEKTAKEQLRRSSTSSSIDSRPQAPHTSGTAEKASNKNPNLRFKDLFPATKTPLTKLPMNKRSLVLHSLLLLLISLEQYSAWSRVLMLNLTSSLKLPLKTFEQEEYVLAKGLLESAKELTANSETKKRQEESKDNRKWRVNLAAAAGAAVIGIAGGLAAPLIATGVGSIMGGLGLGATAAAGYLGSAAGSTMLVGSLFGAYGGRMTGQMMDKYAREVEDFEFLPIHSNQKTSEDHEEGAQQASEHDHKLRVTICISGWLTEKEEAVKPWRVLGIGAEVFALKWELEALLNLGHSMDGMVKSAAWGYAQQQLVAQTIFADLMAAMWPIGLLKVARVLDNPFSVAKSRSDKAGEVLADALINKVQGERPVTLIGYSLGARVIYTCLMSLAQRKAFGLVENAVIIGSPTPSDTSDWRILRTAVSGRLVNVYSTNDYLLGFMYRTSALQYGVAGLQPVKGLAGIENVDVSEEIDGHTRYRFLVGGMLKKIGFEDIDMEAVDEERATLDKILKEEEQQSLQSQRKRLLRRESYKGKEDEAAEAEHEAKEMEKDVSKATEKSLVSRVIEWYSTPKVNTEDSEKIASNIQKAVANPSQVQGVVSDTTKDAQASTQSYGRYVASMLPAMPGRCQASPQKAGKNPAEAAGQATKAADTKTGAAQGYVQQASGYLPNRSSLPSMPFGKSAKKTGRSQPAKAAEKGTDAGQASVNAATNVATDVAKPAADDTLNTKENPANQASKDTSKNASVINQASDKIPGANKAAEVTSDTVGSTAQNTSSTNGGALNTTTSKAGEVGSGAASTATNAVSGAAGNATDPDQSATGKKEQPKDNDQGYLSRASGYVPSMPSMPSWGGKKQAAKVEKRGSEAAPSKPEPKRTDSGVKSPPPKLGPRTQSGNVKPPPRKLSQTPSGMKSPPAKLERAQSGVKNTASDVTKKVADAPQQTAKGVSDTASKPTETGQRAVKASNDAAGKATDTGKQTIKGVSGAASKPAETGQQAVKAGSDAAGKVTQAPQQAVKAGGDATGKVTDTGKQAGKAGSEAAGKATGTGKQAVKAGGDAAGKAAQAPQQAMKTGGDAASKAAQAPQQAVKAGGDATGKATETGQKAMKQGGGYLSSAGGAVTSRLPTFGRS